MFLRRLESGRASRKLDRTICGAVCGELTAKNPLCPQPLRDRPPSRAGSARLIINHDVNTTAALTQTSLAGLTIKQFETCFVTHSKAERMIVVSGLLNDPEHSSDGLLAKAAAEWWP